MQNWDDEFNDIIQRKMKLYTEKRNNSADKEFHHSIPIILTDVNFTESVKKYPLLIVDFWASWCGPCRIANKGLAKIYDKFREKGFEIYSVSLDGEKEDWLKAIKKDKITWMQVIDPGGWETPTAARWEIVALPTSYLIDRDGRLIAMDLEGKHLEKALKELIDK